MLDANRKAMFANLKTHRVKNFPSLDNEHFLVTPYSREDALMLRNAQKVSAKISDQRNKAFLRDKQYDDTWKNHQIYFHNPKYIEIENKITELQKHRFSRDNYDQYEKNKPLIKELKNQLDDVERELRQKENKEKKIRKSSAISFSVLHRNATKNQHDLENLVRESRRYDVNYDIRDKLTKTKPKGFDSSQTPDYKSEMLFKLYKQQDSITNPLRDEIKNQDNLIKKLEEKYKPLEYKDFDNPERKKAYNELQNARNVRIKLYDKVVTTNDRFNRLQESVHGHIPKFKR